MSRRLSITLVVALLSLGTIVRTVAPVTGAAVTSGYRDFSFAASSVTAPTGEKPQSKLWFNDGIWWGSLFNRSTEAYQIYRFDWAGQTWSDTGTLIDDRNTSKADALWDGSRLYIASATPTGNGKLMRYSYTTTTKRYTLDTGFPIDVTAGGVEALVLDKDTTGRLWVAYTQNSRVMVNRSTTADTTWGTPFSPPVNGTTVSADDIAAVIAYNGSIGVMWSNQVDDAIYFASHRDGDPDMVWESTRTAIQGPKEADDHLNLKSLQADASGRVFAVVKTARNEEANPNPNSPLIRLLVLRPDGNWGNYVFGRTGDDHTRPIVMIDDEHRELYVFATADTFGGTIYYKKTSLDNISFATGRGTPFIQSATDLRINNATSTKQNVNSATGLLVLAADDSTRYYLHNTLSLGMPAATSTPTSMPSATRTPTASSTPAASPTPTTPGSTSTPTSVPSATSTPLASQTPTASPTPIASPTPTATTSGGIVRSFAPAADAHVKEASPKKNYGTSTNLQVEGGNDPRVESYLRFAVSGVSGSVQKATLRLYVTNGSVDGPGVYTTSNSWTESGITWNNRPAPTGGALADAASIAVNAWVEYDVTAAVSANGTYSFVLTTLSNDSTVVNAREGTPPPQLVITTSGG